MSFGTWRRSSAATFRVLPPSPCCAVLCRAVPCRAVLCRAVPCCDALCCAALCGAVPCGAVPCRALQCRVVPCQAVSCRVVSCRAVSSWCYREYKEGAWRDLNTASACGTFRCEFEFEVCKTRQMRDT